MRLAVEPAAAGVRVRLLAESNYTYRVEAGVPPASWSALFTTNSTGMTNDVVDVGTASMRLYRAVLLP